MDSPRLGGASISARTRTPSLNLARLTELVAKAIPANETANAPFLTYRDGRLRLHVMRILRRLYQNKEFLEDLAERGDTGFLRDLELPPRGMSAKIGGRLVSGSESKTTAAIEKLRTIVAGELDATLPNEALASLIVPSAQDVLERLATRLDVRLGTPQSSASLVPVGFAAPGRNSSEREKDVARVLSAVETVEGRDWLERLLAGIRNQLRKDDLEDDEIEPVLATIRAQREQPGSQIRRFLDFLTDEALARVRLQVTFKLMESIAANSGKPGIQAYVNRVLACFAAYGSASGEALSIDVSSVYGLRSSSDFADHLRKALFFGCLPVWAEWSVQLFEVHVEPENGFATKREVSYRFRINGNNPETQRSAYATRLDRIEQRLLTAEPGEGNHARSLAELLFLRLVIPDSFDNPTDEDLQATAQYIVASLKARPTDTVRELIDELRKREPVVEHIAKGLVKVLQTKSAKLVSEANRVADKFYVALHKTVVDWPAVRSMVSRGTETLMKNDKGHDNVEWFKHLTVTENPSDVKSIASYWVETHLMERSVTPTGESQNVSLTRSMDEPVLPVRFFPVVEEKNDEGAKVWRPVDLATKSFDVGSGIDVVYDVRALTLSKTNQGAEKAKHEQLRAAGCAAFALLVYVTLWELVRGCRIGDASEKLALYLLRLQPGGKDVDSTDGNAAVYAACQAIERALARELTVKMQGFHTQGPSSTQPYRKRNALLALQGGMPLQIHADGSLDHVALVSYVTRPCDTHPAYPDADGFLFMSRTFVANRAGERFHMRVDGMLSRLVENRAAFREPELVLEEVARLRAAGCRHIILLSHHYGNRHIGRAAERHSPHATHEFLESVAAKFPDVCAYVLRRDVFPATRLHTRAANESAFEVVNFSDHQMMYEQSQHDLLRGLQPVYTFATLAVVGEEGRPQSGFCTYFFEDDQRITNFEWSNAARDNMLGRTLDGKAARASLLAVLRGVHYLESERPATTRQILPVLDPFSWVSPSTAASAGELTVMTSRTRGSVLLLFPALLAHVTKVLHKNKEVT